MHTWWCVRVVCACVGEIVEAYGGVRMMVCIFVSAASVLVCLC